MPFNNKNTTKSLTPFKPTAQKVNSKGLPAVGKQSPSLAVPIPGAQDTNPTTNISHSPSNEENIQPAKEQSQRPNSPLLVSVAQERDMRAYEHERQRTKRATDRAINRARKAAVGGGRLAPSTSREEREAKRKTRGRFEVEVDAGVDAVGKSIAIPAGPLIEGLQGANPGDELAAIARANATAIRSVEEGREVMLSDLVVLSQRKARKIKDEDFELVPVLRTVIALDDMPRQAIHDMELDEPWEHIESEFGINGEAKKIKAGKEAEPSYAKIVATPFE